MATHAANIIDALGGTSKVAEMTENPTSTVHSWRKIGIPQSRLAHLKLAAKVAGHTLDLDDPATVAAAAARRSTPADTTTQEAAAV